MRVCCGIVTYNPDLILLNKNILAIGKQVPQIFIVDNGSKNLLKIQEIANTSNKIYLISNKKNEGIAKALNELCLSAMHFGYNWIITLDQDSICPPKFVESLSEFASKNVGIVAPIIIDRNVGVIGHAPINKPKEVRTCITSGALTNLRVWKKINGFDEQMFIDSVDFEFCYRVRKAGFKILQLPSIKLNHSVGEARKYRFLFWTFLDTEHNAFRAYYISQNNIYYPRKHRLFLRLIRGNLRNIKYVFVVLLYEKDKIKKIKSIFRGCKNGYRLSKKYL